MGVCIAATALAVGLGVMLVMDYLAVSKRRLGAYARLAPTTEKQFIWDGLLRNGIPFLSAPARLLTRQPHWMRLCERASEQALRQDLLVSLAHVSELLLATILLLAALVLVISRNPFLVLIALIGFLLILSSRLETAASRYHERLREQLPDALNILGFSFMAGCSLEQALRQCADETPAPLGAELARASDDLVSGQSIDDALSALAARNRTEELSFLIVALKIQHQTGGSLRDTLTAAADSVRAATKLKRQLWVQTAQARLSFKVVSLMPLALMAVLSLAMEGYLASFFSSLSGFMVLLIAVSMELFGIFLIHRILKVGQQ
jgi:tight adherence protein B